MSPSLLQHPHQVVTHFILGCLEVQNILHGQKISTLNRNRRTMRSRNKKQVAKPEFFKSPSFVFLTHWASFSPSESSACSFSSENTCASPASLKQLPNLNSPMLARPRYFSLYLDDYFYPGGSLQNSTNIERQIDIGMNVDISALWWWTAPGSVSTQNPAENSQCSPRNISLLLYIYNIMHAEEI